jgi:hypothetical protein
MNTIYPYSKGFIVLQVDGLRYRISGNFQYDNDVTNNIRDKTKVTILRQFIENANDIRVHYVPIFHNALELQSNILTHNDIERFNKTKDSRIELTRYPYIDPIIIGSNRWILNKGLFYNKDNFSIAYEPIVVRVDGVKAFNLTDYRNLNTEINTPEDAITYTVDGSTITFNKNIDSGNIEVQYYFFGNSYFIDIEMFKGDNSKYFITPELASYTTLLAVKL